MRRKWLLALALALGPVLALAVAVAAPPSRSQAAPPPSRLLTFRDHRSALAFTIEAEPLSSEAGRFAFRLPGRGAFLSVERADLRVNSPTSTIVRYEGPADFVPGPARRTSSAAPCGSVDSSTLPTTSPR